MLSLKTLGREVYIYIEITDSIAISFSSSFWTLELCGTQDVFEEEEEEEKKDSDHDDNGTLFNL